MGEAYLEAFTSAPCSINGLLRDNSFQAMVRVKAGHHLLCPCERAYLTRPTLPFAAAEWSKSGDLGRELGPVLVRGIRRMV